MNNKNQLKNLNDTEKTIWNIINTIDQCNDIVLITHFTSRNINFDNFGSIPCYNYRQVVKRLMKVIYI